MLSPRLLRLCEESNEYEPPLMKFAKGDLNSAFAPTIARTLSVRVLCS